MSVQVENLEHNMAKLTVEVSAAEFEKAVQRVYMKQKNKINIPGFRKGKAPRNLIEKMFGAGIFYEDAANQLLPGNYTDAAKESGLDIVSMPAIDIVQMETGKDFIFTAEVAVKPDVELGEYVGVAVTKIDCSVGEEEITQEIEGERERNARMVAVEDRPVQNGDTVVIDYDGYVDGEAFEGGKGENHPLVIGTHSFIDTFEDQLIGHNAGDEVEVDVTFPEDYHAKELAGRQAVFQVKIHEIKERELPALDDEFAQDVSEYDTFEEYKDSVKKRLSDRKEDEALRAKEDEAVARIVEASTMDIPDAMVETQVQRMVDEFAQRIAQSGLTMEQYLQFSGSTMDQLREQMKPDALKTIKGTLVLGKIAEKEGFEVSDEEVEEEISKTAAMYMMEVEKFKEMMQPEDTDSFRDDIKIRKAVNFIIEKSVEQEAAEKEDEAKEASAAEEAVPGEAAGEQPAEEQPAEVAETDSEGQN